MRKSHYYVYFYKSAFRPINPHFGHIDFIDLPAQTGVNSRAVDLLGKSFTPHRVSLQLKFSVPLAQKFLMLSSLAERVSIVTNLSKKIGLFADIAIIVVAILLISVLVKNYLWSSNPLPSNSGIVPTSQQQISGTISLPDIDWQKNNQTLLLVLSNTCHFCSESAPFYQQLMKERESNTRIIAVLPQSISDGRDYLNRLGVTVDGIKQASLSSIGVRATPTLILVDRNGVVVESWVGKLPNTEEAKVIKRMHQSIARK